MVSAVFHSPLEASQQLRDARLAAKPAVRAEPAEACAILVSTSSGQSEIQAQRERRLARAPFDTRAIWLVVLPPVIGALLLVGIWALLTKTGGAFPTPSETFAAALKLFADPFYDKGPNDQGIGWNILFSLERVGVGFGLAALVGIPLGFAIGRFAFIARMVNPRSACCGRSRRWPGCRSACWSSRRPTRPRSGPSSSARSGRW